ncbi:hypothetical protein THII_0732 [Thioploca ingrica]|uniref:Uncharacterized protein n=1 Tax=Thioploca ingrica TaxID=40754 RepID=A0A090ADU0_9GAMM|nr:hypothetical protein THII_0732 [Thioploca ingrica]
MPLHNNPDVLEVENPETSSLKTSPKQNKRRHIYFTLISWSLSILILVGMFSVVPFREVWVAIRQVNPLFILLAIVFSLISLGLRGYRWALLFSSHSPVSLQSAFSLTMIELAVNATLPGKVGELVKIGLATKKFRTSVIFTTATVVIERLLDGIILLILLGLSLFLLPSINVERSVQFLGYIINNAIIINLMKTLTFICISLVVIVVGLAIPYTRNTLYHWLSRLPLIGQWINQKTTTIFNDINNALNPLREIRVILQLFLYSVAIWLAQAVYNYLISLGMIGIQLTFLQAVAMTSIAIAVSSIPSAPGAWGVLEAGALFALVILGVPFEQPVGVAYVLTFHAINNLLIVLLGVIFAFREHISLNTIGKDPC